MQKRKHAPRSFVVPCKHHKGATCVCLTDDDFYVGGSLPTGPASYEELRDWPLDLLHRACRASEPAVNRMRDFVWHGLSCNSDYSGYDCPREMLTQLFKGFTHADFFACQHSPSLRFSRSCDNADLPFQVLLYLAEVIDGGDSCVMTDIEGCLTQDAKDHLDKIAERANKILTSTEKKAALKEAFEEMQAWLILNRGSDFTHDFRSPCASHGRACPLAERLADHDQRLVFNFAGTTCIGWSTVGKRGGFSDSSERTHAVWMTQRICMVEQKKEHGFFQDIMTSLFFL